MLKEICVTVALALAFSGGAWAKGTKHRPAKHKSKPAAAKSVKADLSAIDRCEDMRYAEKVNCLHHARGSTPPENYVGMSNAAAAGGTAAGPAGAR